MASQRNPRFATQAAGGCATIATSIFFIFFLAMGVFFEGLVAREFLQTVRGYVWTKTECFVVSSRIADGDATERRDSGYHFEVEYTYTSGGGKHTSRQFALKPKGFSDYGEVQRLALRYAPETKGFCYVNPAAPEQAILNRGNLWFGLMLLFPLIFVVVGGGGLFITVRGALRQRGLADGLATQPEVPLSDSVNPRRGKWAGVAFFGVFFLMGMAFLWIVTLRPALLILAARGWQQTPCVIVASEVKDHPGSDGTTYSVNILYAYESAGRPFRANRYHFVGGSSSGSAGKAAIVHRYPAGFKTFCFVNPRDPTDAVLNRGFTTEMCWGLLPLVFVLVGLVGITYSLRGPRVSGSFTWKRKPGQTAFPNAGGASRETRALKAKASPIGKLLGTLFVACFWNGIVSVFLGQLIQSFRQHRPEWFLAIFLVPFVLIGLGLIGLVGYTFLALFNPRPRLRVTPGAVPLGGTLEVKWELSGRTRVLRQLHIFLEGREEAQYRRGTRTYHDKSVFATLDLVQTRDVLAMQSGQARLTIPPNLMHSWTAPSNKILWVIQVHGDIARWPDVKVEFPLTVLPKPLTSPPHERA